jgi:hypothetical protein
MTDHKPTDGSVYDPATYAEMSKPHDSSDALTTAFRAFFEDLRAIRLKHKIRDIVIVVCDSTAGGGDRLLRGHIGDATHALPMIATAFGQYRAEHMADIDSLVVEAEAAAVEQMQGER